jgi:hypothetical protein
VFVSYDGRNQYTRVPPVNDGDFTNSIYTVQSPAAYDEQVGATLLNLFYPRSIDHWLYDAVAAMQSSDALKYSLRAFGLSRIGFAEKDQALVVQSFAAYGKALRGLRTSIAMSNGTGDEGITTAISVVSLFEVRLSLKFERSANAARLSISVRLNLWGGTVISKGL